jgi:SAM-dependent methyltransferase
MTTMAWLRWDGLQRALRSVRPSSVLEVGAGQGSVGARLAAVADYVGVEPDAASAAVARSRVGSRGTVVEGTIDDVPADARFDLVCAFEVLEHIEDDAAALAAWCERLVPGGFLLISVPAHRDRFGPVDELVGHHRRYDRDDLVSALEGAGFSIRTIEGYGFGLGHALEAGRNWLIGRRSNGSDEVGTPGSGRLYQPQRLTGAVTMLAAAPGRVLQRAHRRPDAGVGWLVLAQAPGSADEAPGSADEAGREV